MSIAFDQFQRYKTAQLFLDRIKKSAGVKKLKILEVGANEQFNLEKMMPGEDICYVDINVPDYLKDNPKYIQADATDLKEIGDGEYDVVLGLDIFEHISSDRKALFIKEINRVSSYCSLISAPFYSRSVAMAEERANEFFRVLTGEDHIWLKEHAQCGLPDLEETLSTADSLNLGTYAFKHGNLEIWENMMTIFFISYMHPEIVHYRELVESYYNQSIYQNDISGDCYRTFLLMSGDRGAAELIGRSSASEFHASGDACGSYLNSLKQNISFLQHTMLLKEFNSMRAENDLKIKNELSRLQEMNSSLYKQYSELENSYKRVISSKSWRITKPLRFIMKMFC